MNYVMFVFNIICSRQKWQQQHNNINIQGEKKQSSSPINALLQKQICVSFLKLPEPPFKNL